VPLVILEGGDEGGEFAAGAFDVGALFGAAHGSDREGCQDRDDTQHPDQLEEGEGFGRTRGAAEHAS
jgi:hypothetical protein